MSSSSRRALFWAPRALCIAFIAFVSMFALDVFGAGYGFWRTLGALAMHLIPTFVMVAALAAAWRWEWIGTVLFMACAVVFMFIVRGPWWVKMMFTVPCLVTACLFLWNWRKRAELHARPGS
jgi:hypothetical protein